MQLGTSNCARAQCQSVSLWDIPKSATKNTLRLAAPANTISRRTGNAKKWGRGVGEHGNSVFHLTKELFPHVVTQNCGFENFPIFKREKSDHGCVWERARNEQYMPLKYDLYRSNLEWFFFTYCQMGKVHYQRLVWVTRVSQPKSLSIVTCCRSPGHL